MRPTKVITNTRIKMNRCYYKFINTNSAQKTNQTNDYVNNMKTN